MKTMILVHGAWHNALHWAETARHLTARGYRVLAVDMPGHGLKARFPGAYLRADWAEFPTEPSPVGGVTLADCARAIVDVVQDCSATEKPVLVGHSNFGSAISLAAELVPERLERLIYVTALCPTLLPNSAAYWSLPEAEGAAYLPLLVGDPAQTLAVRLNPRSSDPAYISALRHAFYGETSWETFLACSQAMTPDQPISVPLNDVPWSRERWGTLPRSFVRCLKDQTVPLPLQDRIIRDANTATPGNSFSVHDIDTDHSPFASCPQNLADILGSIAGK